VLTADLDPRRVDAALKAASVAHATLSAAAQEKLLEAILKLERGEAAVAALIRLQGGIAEGRTRALPSSRFLPTVDLNQGSLTFGDGS
jgi:hypothetical protein